MMSAVPKVPGEGAAAPGGVAGRLPEVSPERAAASTRLLAAGDVFVHEDEAGRLELRADVPQQPPRATSVDLTHAHGRTTLVLTAENGSGNIGDRSWHDFDGDARLLAWTLAYEPLLAAVSGLLGVPLLPAELLPAPAPTNAVWHWVEFRYRRGEADECRGLLGLDQAAVESLIGASGWIRVADGGLHADRAELPVACRVALPAPPLSLARLRALRPGDVVLLGRRADAVSALRVRADSGVRAIDERAAFLAAAVPGGLAIERALTPTELRNDAMTQELPATPNESGEADARDGIPVRVEFLLDTLNLTLAELDRLGAGQILGLDRPIEQAEVRLRANGKVFGSGQLVSIGDLLGVKITRIGDDLGLQ